jgi:hypothetical protein
MLADQRVLAVRLSTGFRSPLLTQNTTATTAATTTKVKVSSHQAVGDGDQVADQNEPAFPLAQAEDVQRAAEDAAGEDRRHPRHPHQAEDIRGVDCLRGIDQKPEDAA